MFDDELLVPLVTDIAFGLTFLVGIGFYILSDLRSIAIAFTIGTMVGYTIHTAAHMVGYSINTNLVDQSDVDH